MAIEVFCRHEVKYLVPATVKSLLESGLIARMEPDSHCISKPDYRIDNLYYDTPDRMFARITLGKIYFREKLCIRAYGETSPDGPVYIEIKRKIGDLVGKRRCCLGLAEAYCFLEGTACPVYGSYTNKQVARELIRFIQQHPVEPAMFISYRRKAWTGLAEPDLRISFDTDIMYRPTDLRFDSMRDGPILLREPNWLMEVKARHTMPRWLASLINDHHLRPINFTKYGRACLQVASCDGSRQYVVS